MLDRALVANELIHWVKKKKKAVVVLKLHFQKAYDTISYNFLDNVLQKMGFGDKWRKWISNCVSTASMSILINVLLHLLLRCIGALDKGTCYPLFHLCWFGKHSTKCYERQWS